MGPCGHDRPGGQIDRVFVTHTTLIILIDSFTSYADCPMLLNHN